MKTLLLKVLRFFASKIGYVVVDSDKYDDTCWQAITYMAHYGWLERSILESSEDN